MNIPSFDKVQLERGGVILSSSPTIDDIVDAMQIAHDENGMEGPPELALECVSSSSSSETTKNELLLLLAFHRNEPPCWLIHYSIPRIKGSSVLLSSGRTSEMPLERRAVCGVISLYRHDCLITDPELPSKAIAWFLGHHSACPELTWIPYDEAVQDADNSIE